MTSWQREITTQLQTHEDAVNLVKQVLQQMGGKVLPPKRPGHKDKYDIMTPERDAFMMDFENYCLEHCWSFFNKGQHPTENKRHEDPAWAAMIESNVYPHRSDIDWHEYCEWVSRGFGDEWFQDEESEDDSTPPPSKCNKING